MRLEESCDLPVAKTPQPHPLLACEAFDLLPLRVLHVDAVYDSLGRWLRFSLFGWTCTPGPGEAVEGQGSSMQLYLGWTSYR